MLSNCDHWMTHRINAHAGELTNVGFSHMQQIWSCLLHSLQITCSMYSICQIRDNEKFVNFG